MGVLVFDFHNSYTYPKCGDTMRVDILHTDHITLKKKIVLRKKIIITDDFPFWISRSPHLSIRGICSSDDNSIKSFGIHNIFTYSRVLLLERV